MAHVFSLQAKSSLWKIIKARYESDLIVKSQNEETGLIVKESESNPEKVLIKITNNCIYTTQINLFTLKIIQKIYPKEKYIYIMF